MKFTLPISDGYVLSWGLWEAIREIWQNALDETDDPECQATMAYYNGMLSIETSRGSLDRSTLVLGTTSKRNRPSQRGKFGEGYKLSLLVLARLGLRTEIRTGGEIWRAKIEFDEGFTCNVLNVYTEEALEREGVLFTIYGVTAEQWQKIQENIRPITEFYNTIIEEPKEAGRVYVGGLYVTTAQGFKCGYAFKAGEMGLDRDRGMVSGFDLAWKTSQMWTDRGGPRAIELMDQEAKDVEYVENHAAPVSTLVTERADHFTRTYGYSTIPVSNQEEIEKASTAGVKWVLVPESVKNVLRLVKSWFIPTSRSPAELLRDFRKKHEYRLTNDMKHDLDEIISVLEPKTQQNADKQ